MKKISKITENVIAVLAVIVLSAVFLSLVWNNNVWMDEAFTASLVHTDMAGVIKRSMADTLPPLYNILLKLATDLFGYTTPVMKITSVIPMILSIVLGATTVRKRFGLRTALLFMVFITGMPLMLYYGVEIRMYSLGFFFATASGIYAYEVISEPSRKKWTAFTLFSVMAGYSHHFAFVTVAFSYLFLLLYFFIKKRDGIAGWLKCLLATFVLYLPCLIVTLKQFSRVSGYFSMPDIDAAMFAQYCLYPYTVGMKAATILCALIMLAALAVFAYRMISEKKRDITGTYAFWCFLTYYFVLLFGTIVCHIMSANIFVDRYLFFSTGLLWLFAAIMLADKKTFIPATVAALIVSVCVYFVEFKVEYGNSADEEIEFLRAHVNEGDVYYSIGGHEEMQNCIPFYTYLDKDTAELEFVHPLEKAIKVSRQRGTTLWITVLDGFEPTDDERRVLDEAGASMEKMADFDFDRYKCEMYIVR